MTGSTAARLDATIRPLCPIIGVSITGATSASVAYASGSTPAQWAAAQAVIKAFDWSDAADEAWLIARNLRRKALWDAAAQSVIDNASFRALKNPSAAQLRDYLAVASVQLDLIIARLLEIQ